MSEIRVSRRYFSLPSMMAVALLAFFVVYLLPPLGIAKDSFYLRMVFGESLLFLILYMAWKDFLARFSAFHFYVLISIFFLRWVFFVPSGDSLFWAFRSSAVLNMNLCLIGYIGMVALHPSVYLGFKRWSQGVARGPVVLRYLAFFGFLAVLALAGFYFRSYHITRDGYDWIERTTNPVWHLYLREPLTIGLYRWVFLLVWDRWEITSFQVIGFFSIGAGLWWACWMGLFTEEKWADGFDRLLVWLLALSSGGMLVLFFAHIEVYAIFIAGLMSTFYFAYRYLQGKNGIVPVSLSFGIAFLLHLSAGWLLPAFLLLPIFKKENKNWVGDLIRFLEIFCLIQGIFWSFLIITFYDASLSRFLSRLHQDFYVGLDRSMFLPVWMWFNPWHLFDLLNVYLYYSVPCFLLIPLCLKQLRKPWTRESGFWASSFMGFFIYSFFWNADRGFPEDWDLFSPITLMAIFWFAHLLLPDRCELSDDSPEGAELAEKHRSLIYLVSMGTLLFAWCQVYFHHIIPFIPPQFR